MVWGAAATWFTSLYLEMGGQRRAGRGENDRKEGKGRIVGARKGKENMTLPVEVMERYKSVTTIVYFQE